MASVATTAAVPAVLFPPLRAPICDTTGTLNVAYLSTSACGGGIGGGTGLFLGIVFVPRFWPFVRFVPVRGRGGGRIAIVWAQSVV